MTILSLYDSKTYLGRGIEVRDRYRFKMDFRIVQGVALIKISGVLMGRFDVELIEEQLFSAIRDDSVHSIVLDMDTPGGDIQAIDLLHHNILKMREVKPIHAVVNTIAASSGYVIASACTSIIMCGENARAGAIGVIFQHCDKSGMLEKEGIKITPIATADGKKVGLSSQPLSKEHEEQILSELQQVDSVFKGLIARARNRTGQQVEQWATGNVFFSNDAIALGMADTVSNINDTILALALNNQANMLGNDKMSDPNTKLKEDFEQRVTAEVERRLAAQVEQVSSDKISALKDENSKIQAQAQEDIKKAVEAERERVAKINALNVDRTVKSEAINNGTSYQDVCVVVAENMQAVTQTPSVNTEVDGQIIPMSGKTETTEQNSAVAGLREIAKQKVGR